MKFLIIIFGVTICSFFATGQNPSINWQNYFGGSSDDIMRRIISPDGGYFFVGHSSSNISGDKTENSRGFTDIWIIKTDAAYTIEWDKTIGGDYYDDVRDVLLINDTLYVLTQSGSSISGEKTIAPFGTFGWSDLWLVAFNINGDLLWQEQYGGELGETNAQIIALNNNNLLIGCISNSDVSGNKTEPSMGLDDIWLLEINRQNGTIIDQKVIGTSQIETLSDIIQLSAGQILIKGGSDTGISGDKTEVGFGGPDIWIVKLDQNYNVISDRCFGGDYVENGNSGQMLEYNGFFYMLCSSMSGITGNKTAQNYGGEDFWLLKLDENLNLIWDKSYGGSLDDLVGGIEHYEFNKIVILGASSSGINGNKTAPSYGGYDMWLLVLDPNGDIVAQESYGGSGMDFGIAEKQQDESKIFITSYSTSDISGLKNVPSYGGYDCWFMELDASSFLSATELLHESDELTIFPNPSRGIVNFKFSDLTENLRIDFYTIDGRLISSGNFETSSSILTMTFTISNQPVLYEISGSNLNRKGMIVLN